jgi:hypothetical protein
MSETHSCGARTRRNCDITQFDPLSPVIRELCSPIPQVPNKVTCGGHFERSRRRKSINRMGIRKNVCLAIGVGRVYDMGRPLPTASDVLGVAVYQERNRSRSLLVVLDQLVFILALLEKTEECLFASGICPAIHLDLTDQTDFITIYGYSGAT